MTFVSEGQLLDARDGTWFRQLAKRRGGPNALLLWLRNWPAAFAALQPAAAAYIRDLGS